MNPGFQLVKCSNCSNALEIPKSGTVNDNQSDDKGKEIAKTLSKEDELRNIIDNMSGYVDYLDPRCEPLVEILSATLNLNQPTQVVGEIKVIDEEVEVDGSSDISTREGILFQSIATESFYSSNGGPITLEVTSTDMFSMKRPVIYVNLCDLSTGTRIAYGSKRLLRATDDGDVEEDDDLELRSNQFEQIREVEFLGDQDGDSLCVKYLSLAYGVVASIDVSVCREGDGSGQIMKSQHNNESAGGEDETFDGFVLYGQILAGYQLLTPHPNFISIPLLSLEANESGLMEVGAEIPLSRYSVVVPAYSLLSVSVDLKEHNDQPFDSRSFIHGVAHFRTGNYSNTWEIITGNDGLYVKVTVTWSEVYNLDPIHAREQYQHGSSVPKHVPNISPPNLTCQVLEVFSIFVGRPHNVELNLYGFIAISDLVRMSSIFERDRADPHKLSTATNLLPLKGLTRANCFSTHFVIALDVNDVDDQVKFRGFILGNQGIQDRVKLWYDRWLCSVIKDDEHQIFAAINYAVLFSAVQARIEVHITETANNYNDIEVSGHVVAFYKDYPYATNYDKKYYRAVIFKSEVGTMISMDRKLELRRDVIAVPISSCLCLEVNLRFETNKRFRVVQETVEFIVGQTRYVIDGGKLGVDVSVHWSGF